MTDLLNKIERINTQIQKTFAAMQQTSVCRAPGYSNEQWTQQNPATSLGLMKDQLIKAQDLLTLINLELIKAQDAKDKLDALVCTDDNVLDVTQQEQAISQVVSDIVMKEMLLRQDFEAIKTAFVNYYTEFKTKISDFLSTVSNVAAAHSPVTVWNIVNECNPEISPARNRKLFAITQVPLRRNVLRQIDKLTLMFSQLPDIDLG